MTRADERYWATLPATHLVAELRRRIDAYYRHIEATGRLALWQRSARTYYGCDPDGGWRNAVAVTFGGRAGELAEVMCNHYRSLLDSRVTLTTSSRPAIEARAGSTDYQAVDNARIAEQVIERDLAHGRLEEMLRDQVWYALAFTEGWLCQTWDANRGDEAGAEEQPVLDERGAARVGPDGRPIMRRRILYAGDIATSVHTPIDVIRDVMRRDTEHDWLVLRRWQSRYRLAEVYPEHRGTILGYQATQEELVQLWEHVRRDATTQLPSDLVPVYDFWHVRSPELVEGRRLLLCGTVPLLDVPMPYDALPLVMLAEAVEVGTPFGHSTMSDLLAPQKVLNAIDTTALSNHEAFGLQGVWTTPGSGLTVEQLQNGLAHYQSSVKPEAVQLTRVSDDTYRLREQYVADMETLSGVNSVARGNPSSNLKSGTSLAMVQAMAVQSNSRLQAQAARNAEVVFSARLRLYQQFAAIPRLVELAGADDRYAVQRFSAQQLEGVRSISVLLGNPLKRTAQGREQLADKLVQTGMIDPRDPRAAQQYLEFIDTGRLEPLYHYPTAEIRYVRWENQALATGSSPTRVVATDNHELHIREHLVLTFDPSIRLDEQQIGAVLAHIDEHQRFLDAAAQQTAAAAAPQAGPAPGATPRAPEAPQPVRAAAPEPPQAAVEAGGELPTMPRNPLTGERAAPPPAPTA